MQGVTNIIIVPAFEKKKKKDEAKSRWLNSKASIISYGQPINKLQKVTLKQHKKEKEKEKERSLVE